VIEEMVCHLGLVLAAWIKPEAQEQWFAQTLRPTLDTFKAIRDTMPLDKESIRAAAKTLPPTA
jgi:hypothetical protein